MNKSTLAIIILSVLLIATGAFAIKRHQDANYWEQASNKVVEVDRSKPEDYNKAEVSEVDKIEDLDVKDEKVKTVIKERVVEKVVYVTVNPESEGGGAAEAVTSNAPGPPTSYTYEDFRISMFYDSTNQTFRYSLRQQFKMNLYVSGLDYRAEILEINRNTGEVVGTYPVEDFRVIQEKDDAKQFNFGFNMMLGGGTFVDTKANFDYNFHGMMNFISHGKSHLDSDWRILSLGAGNKAAVLSPLSYRVSNFIPLFSDIFIDTLVTTTYKNPAIGFGLGLSTTF